MSGTALQEWEKQGRTANIELLDFNPDFSIHQRQYYTLWHANWEVYIGRFVNPSQDGIFLYDRLQGEGRLIDFDSSLTIQDYQELHNLSGNWVVSSGDFVGAGRSQLLLYDPSNGDVQLLTLKADLSLAGQKLVHDLGTNMVLYVGHFGLPTLSIMMYDPQNAQSTFVAFDTSFQVTHEYLVNTWDQSKQILVGAFVDRARCDGKAECAAGDDILVLNRQNGQLEQYVFTFGRKFQVYDNRVQSFVRQGMIAEQSVNAVDSTTFRMVGTQLTSIKNEELY